MLSARCFWFLFSLSIANSFPAHSQQTLCNFDLAFWRPGTFTDESVAVGDSLLVASDFAIVIRRGFSDIEGSHMGYFAYLRPSSRKEVKEENILGTAWERVMPNGDVYGLKKLPVGQSVFVIPEGYNQSLLPEKIEGIWVAPPQLTPWIPEEGIAHPWVVLQKTSEYLLLNQGKQQLVYYRADNNLSYPFQRPEDLRLMEIQRAQARELRGRSVYIQSNDPLQLRTGFGVEGSGWVAPSKGITGQISNIFVLRDMVLIGLGTQKYVVVEGQTTGQLRFLDCEPIEVPVSRGN
jgi:hypothetical protein